VSVKRLGAFLQNKNIDDDNVQRELSGRGCTAVDL
jgi:hypothetical protein